MRPSQEDSHKSSTSKMEILKKEQESVWEKEARSTWEPTLKKDCPLHLSLPQEENLSPEHLGPEHFGLDMESEEYFSDLLENWEWEDEWSKELLDDIDFYNEWLQ